METRVNRDLMAIGVLLLTMALGGCASSASGPTSSAAVPTAGVVVKQRPMTAYMRSRVGTPEELSPLAPAGAKNVRKVGNRWTCEINGRTMVFNHANSCWEPQ